VLLSSASSFPKPLPLPASLSGRFQYHTVDLTAPNDAEHSVVACLSKLKEDHVSMLANIAGHHGFFRGRDVDMDDAWKKSWV
jgi:hypothetical protein